MSLFQGRIWVILFWSAATMGLIGLAGCTSLESPTASSTAVPNSSTPTTSVTSTPQPKINPVLQTQVDLKKQQLADPTPAGLTLLKESGANTENLNSQRVYVQLSQPLTAEQTAELNQLGITPYPDSWIPPVGNFKYGFILAITPVDKLNTLAALDYVIKIDTAEKQLFPQINTPQGDIK